MIIGMYMILFVIELIKYWLVFKVFCSGQVKNKAVPLAGLVIYIGIIYSFSISNVEKRLILYVLVFVIQFLTVELRRKCKAVSMVFVILCVTCVDEILNDLVEYLTLFSRHIEISDETSMLFSNILVLFLLSFLLIKNHYGMMKGKRKIKNILIKKSGVLACVMTMEIAFTFACLSSMKDMIKDQKFYTLATGLCIIAFFSLVVLILLVLYIKQLNEEMKGEIEAGRELRVAQEEHYKVLLEKEAETKRYRHDTINHLICLKELAEENRIDEVIHYIDSLQNNMILIEKKSYFTGNKVLDCLLNYHLNLIVGKVDILIIGRCNNHMWIVDVDLCSIFANLFQNAVEALNRIDESKERHLHIHIKQDVHTLSCQIKNSTGKNTLEVGKRGLPMSSKADHKNHGFGLMNVMETVEKYDGLFDIKQENQEFICSVLLKMNR